MFAPRRPLSLDPARPEYLMGRALNSFGEWSTNGAPNCVADVGFARRSAPCAPAVLPTQAQRSSPRSSPERVACQTVDAAPGIPPSERIRRSHCRFRDASLDAVSPVRRSRTEYRVPRAEAALRRAAAGLEALQAEVGRRFLCLICADPFSGRPTSSPAPRGPTCNRLL